MRLLFICGRNRLRSPTAEAIFAAHDGLETLSAGLNRDAETPVSGDLLDWAEVIFVMERGHRRKLQQRFQAFLKDKRIVVLGIPDDYGYMQPELVRLLEDRVPRHLRI